MLFAGRLSCSLDFHSAHPRNTSDCTAAIENQDAAAYLEIICREERRIGGSTTTHSPISFEERGGERDQNCVLFHHVVQNYEYHGGRLMSISHFSSSAGVGSPFTNIGVWGRRKSVPEHLSGADDYNCQSFRENLLVTPSRRE